MLREDVGGGGAYNDDERQGLLSNGNGSTPTGYTTSHPMQHFQQVVCSSCIGSISSRHESFVFSTSLYSIRASITTLA
jgi:hypothetical protein